MGSSSTILLVYSNTGCGHLTAANALKQAILETCSHRGIASPRIVMQDMIEESNAFNRLFKHMYNRLLKEHQDWMKYYIALIEWTKPNESAIDYKLCREYARKVIDEANPSVIVSVHPMVNHFLAKTLKDMGASRKIKFVVVLTDPNENLWTGWACPDADLTIAPNDLARERLISLGIAPANIQVIGMPIPPEFLKPPGESRHSLLTRLGLDPMKLTVAISAGSVGGGNMPEIFKALQEVPRSVQIIFICGKNAKLKARMELASRNAHHKTVVLPYVTRMADLMNACDLLITKAGGLTTFEAIARRVPMALDLLTEPMPQESGTARMLIEEGLAKPINRASDVKAIIQELKLIHSGANTQLPSAHNLDRVDAVYEIANTILELWEQSCTEECRSRI